MVWPLAIVESHFDLAALATMPVAQKREGGLPILVGWPFFAIVLGVRVVDGYNRQ